MKLSRQSIYRFLSMFCMVALVCVFAAGCKKGPKTIRTVRGDDRSKWEQVSKPGFGNKDNGGIIALCEFKDSIYALTRNDATGFELWRTNGRNWEQVLVAGFTDGIFHDRMNNVWGDMIIFNDKMYVTVSSGFQGSKLYKSVGFEIWRYDGTAWEAVVSHTLGPQVTGTISVISSCAASDGSSTAEFTASSAGWTDNASKGGILWITSGAGKGRVFDIVSNTADTVTVQENEVAGTVEDTVCAEQTFTADPPFGQYTIGKIDVGDSFKIIKGVTANGFGELWNKSIVDLEVYKGELYASVGFNYEKGARIWKSADGKTWTPSSAYSMGFYHGYDHNGNATGVCLVPGQEARNGQPVSSSFPKFGKLILPGEEVLVIGGTGTQGCNGRGVRIFRLYDDGWKPIVDNSVDNNTTGTNENGIGDDGSSSSGFPASNFQAWSWAMHDDNLFTGMGRLIGGRILYTPNADPADGNWYYAVGHGAKETEGLGYTPNIAFNIFNLDNTTLIAGTIEEESFTADYVIAAERGADLWRASGPADDLTWTAITTTAFKDSTILQFEAPYKTADGTFYMVASCLGPSTPLNGAREGYTGAKVYRLASKFK